jgi:hypothetical protein
LLFLFLAKATTKHLHTLTQQQCQVYFSKEEKNVKLSHCSMCTLKMLTAISEACAATIDAAGAAPFPSCMDPNELQPCFIENPRCTRRRVSFSGDVCLLH